MTTQAEAMDLPDKPSARPVLRDLQAENRQLKEQVRRRLAQLTLAAEALRDASRLASGFYPFLSTIDDAPEGSTPEALAAQNEKIRAEAEKQELYLATLAEALRDSSLLAGFDPRFGAAVAGRRSDIYQKSAIAEAALQRLVFQEMTETLRGFGQSARGRWRERFSLRLFLGDLFVAARRARLRPMRTLRLVYEIRLVRSSGLLDSGYYAHQKARTEIPGYEDARNYVLVGRDLAPNRLFSGAAYLRLNPDVKDQPLTPLAHFIRHGCSEGRAVEPPPGAGLLEPLDPESRPVYRWPVAEGRDPAKLGQYEVRPDDAVPVEGRRGRAFLERHNLLGRSPKFAAAVEELKAMALASAVVGPEDAPPQVSVVIPVYGQLAYTLNCLHALLAHASKARFEILIGDDASPDESGHWLPQIPRVRHLRHAANKGFVDNCNATAALARGEHIVLLNNDTRVVDGWLDELIGSFALFPKAGLVGSKLFYDDGALQEAGGIFWRDGSAWNYGREDDPNRPRYCYAREVDYVSGSSIAMPTALWKELEGFDPLFRPAYCEDSDIAFRIRARGLETWMQPLSRVIHYEGRTSGTDLTQGVKAYQVENMKKLAERWSDALGGFRPNGEQPTLERDRKLTKRALVVDAVTPTPNQDAGSVTSVTHMRLYQELGYKVYFAPMDNFLFQREATNDLQRLGIECLYTPYHATLESFLRTHGRHLDVVHLFRVEVATRALEMVRRYAPQALVIFANMDMHHLRMERQATADDDAELMRRAREMKVQELGLIATVDCTIVHSPVEEDILKAEVPEAEVVVFPFITPLMGTGADYEARRDIMFLGGYRHTPNIDAAMFLVKEVWPLARGKLPGAKLLIVGAHPTTEVKALAAEDVIVTGMVEDLRPCFDQTRVFAASIRYGAGVKGKVAQAMAYGVPVVATTIAAEGMFLEDGRDVVIADDAAAFAQALIDLYNDAGAWARFSANGLEFVAEMNSMDTGRRMLAESVRRAASGHVRHTVEDTRALLDGVMMAASA
jgi:GT2 family glycosyltransferase/glycosyltransferase involved in cell wall biosynthesis